jgi:hypothetical protein
MKRLIALVALAVVLIPPSSASAGRFVNVRSDSDDTASILDIQQIGTSSGPPRAFFGVSSYEWFFEHDIYLHDGSYYQFLLDVTRGPEVDRRVRLYAFPPDSTTVCDVRNRRGEVIGTRSAVLMGGTIFCNVPARWLHIDDERLLRWILQAKEFGSVVDRHPTAGWVRDSFG